MAEKKSKKKTSPKPARKKQQTSVRTPIATKGKKPVRGQKVQTKAVSKKTPVKTKIKKLSQKPAIKTTTRPSHAKQVSAKPVHRQKSEIKPSEEERKAILRKTLLKKRAEILQEAKDEISKYIKGETRQLVDTALDDGDWSVVDLSEDISLRKLGVHRETLQKIDEALRKFNEGTYGICEDCGEEISGERLKILPFAIYCIDCQERREQFQEMERKEGLL
jgi:DnaK suppressor protein